MKDQNNQQKGQQQGFGQKTPQNQGGAGAGQKIPQNQGGAVGQKYPQDQTLDQKNKKDK